MQFVARSLSRFIRPSTAKSWVPCHPKFSNGSRSLGSGGDEKPETSDRPRPIEIPYDPKIENNVDLIGHINHSPRFIYGESSSATVITHAASDDTESEFVSPNNFRVPIIFEGDLAHTAKYLLKKGDRVHVNGQIYVEENRSVPFGFGSENAQPIIQVLVREFSKVLPDHWSELLEKPDQWIDFRQRKHNGTVSSRFPGFKKHDKSVALWLNRAPSEIFEKLKDVNIPTEEDLWIDLVENNEMWWDLRLTKRSTKAPDFVHRETRVLLWLRDCPSWLLSELPPLDSE